MSTEFKNCTKCPNKTDCDYHTQINNNYHGGQLITPALRDACPGNAAARDAMRTGGWYYYGLYYQALNGKPYNYPDHRRGDIPEIDFGGEMPKMMQYLRRKSTDIRVAEFKRNFSDNLIVAIGTVCILAGPNFKMPKPAELNYVQKIVSENERCK